MSDDFKAFMTAPAIKSLEVSYVASKRFTDETGEPIAWKFHPITAAENDRLIEDNTTKYPGATGKQETNTDMNGYMMALLAACITYPNLKDEELQKYYGAIGADDLVSRMLLPGELTDLFKAVSQANGFENDMDRKIKKAKN
jgi:hypothetical protein